MKTFEEKWTAWVDGEMNSAESAAFEASLADRTTASVERGEALKLRALLKEQLVAPSMPNEEFFHHQLLSRLASESKSVPREARAGLRETWWTIRRMLWLGSASLAAFAVCAYFVMSEKPASDQSEYLTQILNARVEPNANPDATVTTFESKQDHVTVLWVDGLKSLPSEYAAK